MLEHCISYLVH